MPHREGSKATARHLRPFLGPDTDNRAIFLFFCRHYEEWFPAVGRIHRVTLARQASNLWAMKKPMRGTVCKSVAREGAGLFLVDSLLVCPYGHDAVRKSFFYGTAKGRGV